jgi:hypothetical protein
LYKYDTEIIQTHGNEALNKQTKTSNIATLSIQQYNEVVSLTHRPPLPPGNPGSTGTIF